MATYYVRATGGSDGNTGLSFAQGWATMNYAALNITTSDTLYVCSDASNKFTTTTYLDVNSGTRTTPAKWVGADLVDGSAYNGSGKAYVVSGTSVASFIDILLGQDYFQCFDIEFDGGGLSSTVLAVNTNYQNIFFRCTFKNGTQYIFTYTGNANNTGGAFNIQFQDCSFTESSGIGYGGGGVSFGTYYGNRIIFDNCKFFDNVGLGLYLNGSVSPQVHSVIIKECRFFDNGQEGLYLFNTVKPYIVNSIFQNNGNDGIFFDAGYAVLAGLYNCVFSDNGAYGFYASGIFYVGDAVPMDYNCFYNNTSGNSNISIPGTNNILSDPKFVSTTVGSEDFSLQSDSPLIGTGYGFSGGQ